MYSPTAPHWAAPTHEAHMSIELKIAVTNDTLAASQKFARAFYGTDSTPAFEQFLFETYKTLSTEDRQVYLDEYAQYRTRGY